MGDTVAKEKKLVTLDEWNAGRMKVFEALKKEPEPNGIACSACGAELYDTHPGSHLTGNPPKMQIHCESCGYVGMRLV